jgi:sec-independent protein translocase protein TatA
MIGTWEWVLIIAVVLLLFGAKRIPEIARGLGKAIKEFRKGIDGREETEIDKKDLRSQQAGPPDESKQG